MSIFPLTFRTTCMYYKYQYQEVTDKTMHCLLQAVFRSPDGSIAESLDSNYMSS